MEYFFDKNAVYEKLLRSRIKGRARLDAPLARETSFNIGGPADILFFPENVADAVKAVKFCKREKVPLTVLGGGTNVLVMDRGVRGMVMMLGGLNELRRDGGCVFAGAGCALAEVSRFALAEKLSGLEFACGIPGSAGGAVYMNAGAYGREMKDVVGRSVVLEPGGNVGALDAAGHGFAYRRSVFQTNRFIILEVEFRLSEAEEPAIKAAMDDYKRRREASQPLREPSAGSVFRRPDREGVYVGPMIEKCGLKGARVGGAQVSEKHAGFIVNRGGASAADVLMLIGYIRGAVRARFNIDLKTEIQVIGE